MDADEQRALDEAQAAQAEAEAQFSSRRITMAVHHDGAGEAESGVTVGVPPTGPVPVRRQSSETGLKGSHRAAAGLDMRSALDFIIDNEWLQLLQLPRVREILEQKWKRFAADVENGVRLMDFFVCLRGTENAMAYNRKVGAAARSSHLSFRA